MKLGSHTITLRGARVILRPMTEDDWPILLKWNTDPSVLYFTEADDVSSYTLEQIQAIYRTVSQNAFCFVAELDQQPIGEGWLQAMNLAGILKRYPGQDCRRIDLMIGEKALWGRGLGTEMIELLTDFAFLTEKADLVFGIGIGDYNPGSLRAFQKAGFQVVEKFQEPEGRKAHYSYDVRISQTQFLLRRQAQES